MAIASDVHEVFSRLFDHRPFLKAEISFFKSEFEEKRGDQEVEQLFRALELTTEIKQAQVEKVVEACDANLPRTIADIQVALRMCQNALDVAPPHSESYVERRQKERAERLAAAKVEVAAKLAAVDQTFDHKEHNLRQSFAKLQQETLDTSI